MTIIVKGENFGQEPVSLDGKFFFECKFDKSDLVYSGGDLPSFNKCNFIDTSFNFFGEAGNTLNFMRVLYHAGWKDSMEATFDSIRNWSPDPASISNNRTFVGDQNVESN